MTSLLAVYLGLALMALAQRMAPAGTPPPLFDRSRTNDWAWWIVTPLFTGTLTRVATLGVVGVTGLALGHGLDQGAWLAALQRAWPVPAGRHLWWAQLVEALVLADLIGYWSHRARHARWFWPFHAVHHSPVALDGIAAARMHPIDDLVDNVMVGVPVVALFDAWVLAALGPVLIVHTIFTHGAVRWSFGPLRHVLVTPTFHRWHHAVDARTRDRNFAGMFSCIDRVFGTFYLPEGALPERFGAPDEGVPDTLAAQLMHPFRPR